MSETPPTVVLVHGAFADGSSWGPVISRGCSRIDIPVVAVPNPLRGLTADGEKVRRVGRQPDRGTGRARRPLLRRAGHHRMPPPA